MSSCTLLTIVNGMTELEKVGLKRPHIPKDVHDLAAAYLQQLRDLPAEAVTQAFTRYIRDPETKYWPPVGKLRGLTLAVMRESPAEATKDLRSRYLQWEARGRRDELGQESACPVCEAFPERVLPEEAAAATGNGPERIAAGERRGRALLAYRPTPIIAVLHDQRRHKEAGVPTLS
jgi:hypothetical protein